MENEAELVRQIVQGRSELFEQIVLRYQDLVFSVCLGVVKNPSDAENMAQETFLSAYGSLARFKGGSLKSWLCRIAVNKSIDCKRRQAHGAALPLDWEAVGAAAESVEELLLRKEREEHLNRILSGLPDKYARVLKAFYYGRFSVKEIAGRLSLPERTVETQLYRAKKLIRERWENDGA